MTNHTLFQETKKQLIQHGFKPTKHKRGGDHHKFKKAAHTVVVPFKLCDRHLMNKILKQAGISPVVR